MMEIARSVFKAARMDGFGWLGVLWRVYPQALSIRPNFADEIVQSSQFNLKMTKIFTNPSSDLTKN